MINLHFNCFILLSCSVLSHKPLYCQAGPARRTPDTKNTLTASSDISVDEFISSYHITELAMALIHQSSIAPYIRNTVIVIKLLGYTLKVKNDQIML